MKKLGALGSLICLNHPQINGHVEQANQEMRCFLHFAVQTAKKIGPIVTWAEYAQNSLHHLVAQLTPLKC